jgi:hypothetical protein
MGKGKFSCTLSWPALFIHLFRWIVILTFRSLYLRCQSDRRLVWSTSCLDAPEKVITPARDRTPIAQSIAIYSTVCNPGFQPLIQFLMSVCFISAAFKTHETAHVSEFMCLSYVKYRYMFVIFYIFIPGMCVCGCKCTYIWDFHIMTMQTCL